MHPALSAAEREHGGVFRVAEAVACGYADDEIRGLVRSGRWVRVRHGILAERETAAAIRAEPEGALALSLAGEICARPSARLAASHESAARLLGLDFIVDPPRMLTLTTDTPGRGRGWVSGVRIRRATLPPGHVTECRRLPVTTVARTVVDLAREQPFRNAVVLADSALRRGLTSRDELDQVVRAAWTWPGIRDASRVVEFSDGRAQSAAESVARVLFATVGLPAPLLQAVISDRDGIAGQVDFLFREERTIVEIDGKAKYREQEDALFLEKKRQDRLEDLGYRVVRLTWREIVHEPEMVLRKIA